MGILISALSISSGTLLGGMFKSRIKLNNFAILGIAIMIISLVGFLENILFIQELALKSNDLLVVIFALIAGTLIGDIFQFDTRLSKLSELGSNGFSSLIDAAIFFGVGGMQICGPIMLATTGDNTQLILKSAIDFPFALMFGISYGKRTALSAIPVAIGQFVIFAISNLAGNFLDANIIKQICAIGYIILFFSGFNLMCEKNHKINNINMLIGIGVIILYNIIQKLWR